jgi:N-acetylglucosamine kinase-like BadF-type ATPase
MAYFLGLDGGGSKTECALAEEERVLARSRGGSIKTIRVPAETARENLRALLLEVSAQAGVPLDKISASCAGVSGVSVPGISAWAREALQSQVAGLVVICGDGEVALDAAFPGQPGVLVVAGTGSIVVGRNSQGDLVNAGGFGHVLSDEGSGYWIGRQGLGAAIRAWDRGEPTLLLDRVREFWKTPEVWRLVEHAHATPPPDFAGLAPLVAACAEEGDPGCMEVLLEGGRQLAEIAMLAYRKLRRIEPDPSVVPGIAFTGSILRHVAMVRETMLENIRRQAPAAPIVPEAVDPIAGALWRARTALRSAGARGSADCGHQA